MAKANKQAVIKTEDEWEVEDDMRILMRARAIRNDPKRMERVKTLAQKRLTEVASLAGGDGDE